MFDTITCQNCKAEFKPKRYKYVGFTYTYCPECETKTYLDFQGEDLDEYLSQSPLTDLAFRYAAILRQRIHEEDKI